MVALLPLMLIVPNMVFIHQLKHHVTVIGHPLLSQPEEKAIIL